jgi:hypothetical protein
MFRTFWKGSWDSFDALISADGELMKRGEREMGLFWLGKMNGNLAFGLFILSATFFVSPWAFVPTLWTGGIAYFAIEAGKGEVPGPCFDLFAQSPMLLWTVNGSSRELFKDESKKIPP